MLKKSVSLIFAMTMLCSNFIVAHDHHHDHHDHHNQEFQKHKPNLDSANQEIKKRLYAISEEEKEQYNHTNYGYWGAAGSLAVFCVSAGMGKWEIAVPSLLGFLGSSGMAI